MSSQGFTLAELAEMTNSKVVGSKEFRVMSVNTLENAKANEASFLANPRYIEAMKKSQAGVICIDEKTPLPEGKNFLVSNDPSKAFQMIAELILSKKSTLENGIHPTAIIHPQARIEENVSIGAYCVIEKGAHIQKNTRIYPHVYIGYNVAIGIDCILYPQVTVREDCQLNNRVIIQPGAVIGSCGFGYIPDKQGHYQKLNQIGRVIIEDDVEIGANTTIDRARFNATIIKKGTKIDNLVQVAHNVEIGQHTAIAAQTGIAGSSKVGSHVLMGGQVGIIGHVEVGDQVMLATRTGVSKNLPKKGAYRGSPAIPLDQYNRQYVYLKQIEKFVKQIKELQKQVDELKQKF